MAEPLVEIFYFADCPNFATTRELVEQIAAEAGVRIDLRVVEVKGPEEAVRERFLGSPTVRVDGHDVEPGADTRDQFQYACRIYRADDGFAGQPAAEWVRSALVSS